MEVSILNNIVYTQQLLNMPPQGSKDADGWEHLFS